MTNSFEERITQLQSKVKIVLPSLYIQFLQRIDNEEMIEVETQNYFISFYSCNYLLERNETYEIQVYEKDFLLIGQDGDLGFFIQKDQDNIYSNDLGAVGSLPMREVATNIEELLTK